MTETEEETPLAFLRNLAAFVLSEPEPLEAVSVEDLLTEHIFTLNPKGEWRYAGI